MDKSPERILLHDIRNCLNNLKLNCSCLELFSGSELVESMDSIVSSADRLDQLMGDLDVLRGEASTGLADPPAPIR